MKDYWFRCPSCKRIALIDEEQAHGKVSIQCVDECGFHETGTVEPLIESMIIINKNKFDTTLKK